MVFETTRELMGCWSNGIESYVCQHIRSITVRMCVSCVIDSNDIYPPLILHCRKVVLIFDNGLPNPALPGHLLSIKLTDALTKQGWL